MGMGGGQRLGQRGNGRVKIRTSNTDKDWYGPPNPTKCHDMSKEKGERNGSNG